MLSNLNNISWQAVILVVVFTAAVVGLAADHVITGGQAGGFLSALIGATIGIVGVNVGGNTSTTAATTAMKTYQQKSPQ